MVAGEDDDDKPPLEVPPVVVSDVVAVNVLIVVECKNFGAGRAVNGFVVDVVEPKTLLLALKLLLLLVGILFFAIVDPVDAVTVDFTPVGPFTGLFEPATPELAFRTSVECVVWDELTLALVVVLAPTLGMVLLTVRAETELPLVLVVDDVVAERTDRFAFVVVVEAEVGRFVPKDALVLTEEVTFRFAIEVVIFFDVDTFDAVVAEVAAVLVDEAIFRNAVFAVDVLPVTAAFLSAADIVVKGLAGAVLGRAVKLVAPTTV